MIVGLAAILGLVVIDGGMPVRAAEPAVDESAGTCPPAAAEGEREAWPGQQRWQRLEQSGYTLGDLDVVVHDVYVGDELAWYQQLANTLHADTRPVAIRDLLTVARGDSVNAERIYEAERVLRDQSFLNAARIVPIRCADGVVDAEVRVRDTWTLQVGVGLGLAGGSSKSSFSFQDENIFGSGKTVSLDWSSDDERTTVEFGYRDPSLFRTPWTLGLSHRELSDGQGDTVNLAYPFRRADQAWGFSFDADDSNSEFDFDESGDTAYTAPIDQQSGSVELRRLIERNGRGGWRAGLGWRRDYADYGALEVKDASLRPAPELDDRRLQGPYLSLERFHDRYRSFRNLRSIGRTEDFELGLDARFLAGRYIESERGDDPWFFSVDLDHGLMISRSDLLLTRLSLSGRYDDQRGQEAYYRSVSADYYHRTSRSNTVVLHGEADWRSDIDPEDELYIGGFDGLLAYPDHFRVGDRRWRMHLEDRYVSDVVLFDTIQLGYTAYLETGAVRGLDGRWSRTLADVGAGLRLGSLRSSFGTVAYITLAMPLVDAGDQDNYSIVAGSVVNF